MKLKGFRMIDLTKFIEEAHIYSFQENRGQFVFDDFSEKLAELIVKECAESLWTEECYNSDLALEEFERNSAKIKQHFGVNL
jgi:thymidylate synthase